jgi:hypothetical protein
MDRVTATNIAAGTVYEGYWKKGQYHGTGEVKALIFHFYTHPVPCSVLCFRLPFQSQNWTFASRAI